MASQSEWVAQQWPELVVVRGEDAYVRGEARGSIVREQIATLANEYRRIFDRVGLIPAAALHEGMEATRTATHVWWPEGAQEIAGVASGAGVSEEDVWLVNARTEVLAEARRRSGRGECSVTVPVRPGVPTIGMQTWDWYEHLAPWWHPVQVTNPTGLSWCGITEAGILGKIGLNSAGIAVHFDILMHRDDHVEGVPVHLVATRILAECTSLDAAIELATRAPVSASTAITLHDGTRAISIELSPAGAAVIEPTANWLVHANRFLAPELAAEQFDDPIDPEAGRDAIGRTKLLQERAEASEPPATFHDLVSLFRSEPNDAGRLSCLPVEPDRLGYTWHTLTTIATDPVQRQLWFRAGIPGGNSEWRLLQPTAAQAAEPVAYARG